MYMNRDDDVSDESALYGGRAWLTCLGAVRRLARDLTTDPTLCSYNRSQGLFKFGRNMFIAGACGTTTNGNNV